MEGGIEGPEAIALMVTDPEDVPQVTVSPLKVTRDPPFSTE